MRTTRETERGEDTVVGPPHPVVSDVLCFHHLLLSVVAADVGGDMQGQGGGGVHEHGHRLHPFSQIFQSQVAAEGPKAAAITASTGTA